MSRMDLTNSISGVPSLAPATRTADAQGSGVDLRNMNSAVVLIDVGAWTDGTHAFEIQESDDNSSFSAVASGDLQGGPPTVDGADDDDAIYQIGYLGNARYVRVAVTVTGTTDGAVYGASVVRGHPRTLPNAEIG